MRTSILFCGVAVLLAGQPPKAAAAAASEMSADAREVLDLEKKIGEAIVRGDDTGHH